MTPELSIFTSKNTNKTLSNKLSVLWGKVEKHKKRNANFCKKTDVLFEKFKFIAMPYEQKMAQKIAAQIEHLITFIPKKSLSDTQREELLEWIVSDIDYLMVHPFAENIDIPILQNKVEDALNQLNESNDNKVDAIDDSVIDDEAIEALQDMLDIKFNGDIKLSREELISIIKDPSLLEEYLTKHYENITKEHADYTSHDSDNDGSFNNNNDQHDYFEKHTGSVDPAVLEKFFKESQLNKMYKRLASKLHPDKENDEAKKLIKHDLMQQLAKARKDKDVFTIFTLYHEHIGEESFNFDDETIAAIELLLNQKVSELNYELRELKSSDTIECIVWRNFNGRSNKITEQNIENHANQLKDEFDSINQFLATTTTVKAIKVELNKRIKKQTPFSFINFDTEFDKFMGF